mgnify:CR=1 FL=1
MIVVYQTETDGELYIVEVTQEQLQTLIKKYNLPSNAYAIFEGKILKTFDQKFNFKK